MLQLKLTKKEEKEYQRLLEEDDGAFTVIDLLDQLECFKGRFTTIEEKIGFIEYLSEIFHIKWDSDVYGRNHLRLFDIMTSIQYYVEKENDEESREVAKKLIEGFRKKTEQYGDLDETYAIYPDRNLLSRYFENMMELKLTEKALKSYEKMSSLYGIHFWRDIMAGRDREWSLSERKGVWLDELSYEPLKYEKKERLDYLKKWMEDRKNDQ